MSILLFSSQSSIPEQKEAEMEIGVPKLFRAGIVSTSMGFIAAFLPGFGSAQAAILGQSFAGKLGDEGFLALVGGINTANMLISIATAYALSKARNGAIVGVMEILGQVTREQMMLFISVALIAGGSAGALAVYLSKATLGILKKMDYKAVVFCVILFILVLALWFDGFLGMAVLGCATALGVFAAQTGTAKNHLMGCLILPVIVYLI